MTGMTWKFLQLKCLTTDRLVFGALFFREVLKGHFNLEAKHCLTYCWDEDKTVQTTLLYLKEICEGISGWLSPWTFFIFFCFFLNLFACVPSFSRHIYVFHSWFRFRSSSPIFHSAREVIISPHWGTKNQVSLRSSERILMVQKDYRPSPRNLMKMLRALANKRDLDFSLELRKERKERKDEIRLKREECR